MTTSTATLAFTANRKSLLAAYNAASAVSPLRSPKPILQSVLLVVRNGAAQIFGTDLEIGVRVDLSGVRADEPVEVVLPRKFGEILSKSTDEELSIRVDDEKVHVTGLRSKFALPTEDSTLFPEVPDVPADTPSFVVAAGDLRRLIQRTQYACDVESTRYALGGVLVVPALAEHTITFVGTDGRRLAQQKSQTDAIPNGNGKQPQTEFTGTPVIPVKALKLIARSIADCDPDALIHLYLDSTRIILRTPTSTIYSRLVEGRFPRYQDVFPNEPKATATTTAGELRLACQQALITTSEESHGVDFSFTDDLLTLASQSADAGASTIELMVKLEGPPVEVTLDPRYLLEALQTIGPLEEVRVELIDAKHAIVMRTYDDFSYVAMPLTRER